MERETREGGLGSRPGGAARQSGQDGTHHGALRDRFETVCEVSRFTILDTVFDRASSVGDCKVFEILIKY